MTIPRDQFEDLVSNHHAAVFRTASRLLPAADAEDVTQQVFARAWQGKVPLAPDPEAKLRWLAARLALNHLRAARTRRRKEEARAMLERPVSPPDESIRDDERAALSRALADLPGDLHAAVVLRFHDGMTFDGIAHALACAESTAHDRVRRGVEQLKHLLARAGFAAFAARVDRALPLVDAAGTPLPADLQARLLAVPDSLPTVAAAPLGWLAAAAVVLGAFAVGSVAWLARTPPPVVPIAPIGVVRDGGDGAPPVPPTSGRSAVPAAGTTPGTADARREPHGRITGNVFDAGSGLPLADCTVHATSWARGSKGRPFVLETNTDATGRYGLDVPVSDRGQESYSVWVSVPDYAHYASGATLVRADATVELRIALRRWATDLPGAWQAEVTVLDDAGRPCVGALVQVQRRQPDTDQQLAAEADGRTDVAGRVTLKGTHHGEKLVRASLPRGELAPVARALAITAPGPHAIELRLAPGQTLSGTLRNVADGSPLPRVSLRATQAGTDAGWATTDADGRFAFTGLAAEPTDVILYAPDWSPFRARDLAPGGEPLVLHAKPATDSEAHGLFDGELHGTVRDAATGAPIAVSVWDVDTEWVAPGDDGWATAAWREVINPRPAQRAMQGRPRPPASDFHVVGLRAGRYALVVRARGYAPSIAGVFEVGPDRLIAGIDVRMQRGGTVAGVVQDADGNGVRDALFWVSPEADPTAEARATAAAIAGGERYAGYRYHAKPDADGAFRLPRLPAGITLRAVAAHGQHGIAVSAPFVLRDDGVQEVVLRLSH